MSAPLTLVVAVGRDGVIGRDGDLPWHHAEDLRHFKQVTLGHAVVMGRKTFESIGRPLPRRRNIVLTRHPERLPEGVEAAEGLEAALALARATDPEPMVIGGAEVYRQALPQATRIHLTRVDETVAGGDTFFPELDPAEWTVVEDRPGDTPGLRFQRLERRG